MAVEGAGVAEIGAEIRIQANTAAYWRVLVALFLAGFVTFASLYSAQPLLPVYGREFDVPPATASLALSFATAGLAICLLPGAALADAWGRKRAMAFSLLAAAALSLACAAVGDFAPLLALRALQGAVLAGLPANAMAYLGDEIEPRSAGLAMGVYVSGTTVGGMSGRIFTSLVAGAGGWREALAALGAVCLVCGAAFWLLLPPPRTAGHGAPRPAMRLFGPALHHLRDGRLRALYAAAFLLMGTFVPLYNYLGFELLTPAYGIPPAAVGWVFLLYLIGTFSATWMGRQADRRGQRPMLRLSVGLMAGGLLVTAPVSLAAKLTGVALATFGFFGAHAICSTWVARHAASHRGQASSLYLLFYYLGASAGGYAGGLAWSLAGWPALIALLLAFLALAGTATLALPAGEGGATPAATIGSLPES
ncbi:MAG TPA: MFS transporter [Chloroflexota bacterium]|nr:MFS transporter [Chloroflexota bacterium]